MLSLDNIGINGFGHDFGSLDGKKPDLLKALDLFVEPEKAGRVSHFCFLLSPVFPFLLRLPTRAKLCHRTWTETIASMIHTSTTIYYARHICADSSACILLVMHLTVLLRPQ